MQQDLEE
jgi:hypothetical protein